MKNVIFYDFYCKITPRVLPDFIPIFCQLARPGSSVRIASNAISNMEFKQIK